MKVKLVPACDCLSEHMVRDTEVVWQNITFVRHDHDESDDPNEGIITDFYFECCVCKERWKEEIVAS